MLYNIDPLLGPELLAALRGMGHGDEVAIVDANFPAVTCARRLLRLDGVSATRALRAVVSVLPLDAYVDCPAHTMEVVGDPGEIPPIVQEFQEITAAAAPAPVPFGALERFAFYARVKEAALVVATGEQRLYGNILLKKGVIAGGAA
ncbi:MAG: ribose ABC transporter [Gammaproteobacteria bacterium]|nr:ribose ABC transporter [Gammaproteobacteria bacterium]MCY4281672.1 ribose ABC transporter [Gammaproteobacteria bacterium]